ncbi:MAG TPA: transglutaminase family protein [Tepidisphaeraceae bacterium]|nr:transglutaminase family protein [Tepidisphaeraceae bacterium]
MESMLLRITHQTDLRYSDLISETVMELRMAPRQEQDQHRLSFALGIGPEAAVTSYFDWLGNTVHMFNISPSHQQVLIIATSVVETDRPRKQPERFSDRWPIAEGALDYTMYDYLHFDGGPVVDSPELARLAEFISPTPGASLGELALRMLHLIDDKFTYKKGVTNAASPITDMLKTGYGVCQDFTHLMIALARSLKIPARYVSGFVHPDAQRFRGYTQTHAWCELFFPSAGWVGFDAANRCVVGGNFIKVGVGRDFRDVPPNRGLFIGTGKEKIDVQVLSEELSQIPPELAAERVYSLEVPVYPAGYAGHREFINQQMEHQQQQQQ